jgi:hypothetical protein
MWFFVLHDSHNISFIHFPLIEKSSSTKNDEAPMISRELTFFAVSIGGLYYTNDDIRDDDSVEVDEAHHCYHPYL